MRKHAGKWDRRLRNPILPSIPKIQRATSYQPCISTGGTGFSL
jgi:hypothetical protein